MNDAGLDPDTAERMLRGEPTGPPRLAALLTAAASGLTGEDPDGREAAVTAFREARARTERPRARRLAALVSLKAALVGLLLVLVGGAAVAATAPHLPDPLAPRHSREIRTPTTARTTVTRTPPPAAPRPTPETTNRSHPHPPPPEKHGPKGGLVKSKPRRHAPVPSPRTGAAKKNGPKGHGVGVGCPPEVGALGGTRAGAATTPLTGRCDTRAGRGG